MKQSVTVGAQLLWGGRYGCNNGRYGCTIVMSYIEINKAVSQWLLTFNLCVSVTWPLTCAFHIPCTHTPEIIDMHRGVCDKSFVRIWKLWLHTSVANGAPWRHMVILPNNHTRWWLYAKLDHLVIHDLNFDVITLQGPLRYKGRSGSGYIRMHGLHYEILYVPTDII